MSIPFGTHQPSVIFLSLCFELGWASATLLMVPCLLCGNPSEIFQNADLNWNSGYQVLVTLLNFVMLCKRWPVLHVNYCSVSGVCAAVPLFHLHKSCFMTQSFSESVMWMMLKFNWNYWHSFAEMKHLFSIVDIFVLRINYIYLLCSLP